MTTVYHYKPIEWKGPRPKITPETAKKLYTALIRCRKFDEKVVEFYGEQQMKCPAHLSLGQEAAAAGICGALEKTDTIFSTHRCHAHGIAKGGDAKLFMAELYGKATGCGKGKGGSMHFVQPEIGFLGSSAIVGASAPLACGAALNFQMTGKKSVAVGFFGDGAVEQGTFHESCLCAAWRKLPVIFACENNFIATATHIETRQPTADLYKHAQSYGIPSVQVDGTKLEDVYAAACEAVERARSGAGPFMIESRVYRWKEHVGPNPDYSLGHRTKEELDEWIAQDPVKKFETYALSNKLLDERTISQVKTETDNEMSEAIKFGKESPFPKTEALFEDI